MGPFFYSKYEIPANSIQLTNFNFLRLVIETPPKAITSFFVRLDKFLNLYTPKKFLFFLKREDKNIFCTA